MSVLAISELPAADVIDFRTREVIARGNRPSNEEIARTEVAKLLGGDPKLNMAQNLAAYAVRTRAVAPFLAARNAVSQVRCSFDPRDPNLPRAS